MAGNKPNYIDAMGKGHNAAWDGEWARAASEYRRALAEFPSDINGHVSLAHALEESGQLEAALYESRVVAKLLPQDPMPQVRISALLEKLGRNSDAATTCLAIAEMYAQQKEMDKAIGAWQKAALLEPDRTDVHIRLAGVFEIGGQRTLAAREWFAVAEVYAKRGDNPKAIEHARKALGLDPRAKAAQGLLDTLEAAGPSANGETGGPVEQAQQLALSRLAATLLEDQPATARVHASGQDELGTDGTLGQLQVDALIARAVDAQTQHRVTDAIECYRQLLALGVDRPEVKLNLGLLYLETRRLDEAVSLLSQVVQFPNYALAAHFALGRCYRSQGKLDAAVEHFVEVTKIVDLGNVRREQADELISVYEGLAESYAAKGDREKAESFSRSLEELLTSKGWEDKLRESRRHLDTLRQGGGQVSLAEVINLPQADLVLESLALSLEHMQHGKLQAASEECYRAIELAPNYIPPHARLAEVLLSEGRTLDAKAKYRTLAELTSLRGELARAEDFTRQLLKIDSGDLEARSRLAEFMTQQGRQAEAFKENLELGAAFAESGRLEEAASRFKECERIGEEKDIPKPAMLDLRRRQADVLVRRGDWKGALGAFQDLLRRNPEDGAARQSIVDLQLRLGDVGAASASLEEIVGICRKNGDLGKATAILENFVQTHSDVPSLRAGLAQVYMEKGDKERTIATLDALGELQLSRGQKAAAAATIRQIIALSPPRVEEYRQLLQQIGE